MSTINLVICALCLISTLSAIPAPGIIFSAVIRNIRHTPVQCTILWATYSSSGTISETITVESNQHTVVNERSVSMGTWTAGAFIQEIHCDNLKLVAPFPKVTRTQRCWQFLVDPNEITSVGPGSCVQ